jgi:hypothetical protein
LLVAIAVRLRLRSSLERRTNPTGLELPLTIVGADALAPLIRLIAIIITILQTDILTLAAGIALRGCNCWDGKNGDERNRHACSLQRNAAC